MLFLCKVLLIVKFSLNSLRALSVPEIFIVELLVDDGLTVVSTDPYERYFALSIK